MKIGTKEAATLASAAMKNMTPGNLQNNLAAAGIDTTGISLTEETAPQAKIKAKVIVESSTVPIASSIKDAVSEATGGTVEGVQVNADPTTKITTTSSETPETESDNDWAITPMISIWSVLYAMALS